ncbi:hypothetical protein [Bdellovibrio sp. HCB337]|uniref:hypothetical protein n=1 Tax=Bdellovibrio sp. HCB337 TaxID=3394358 RepID=UPI0039A417A2
MIDEIFGCGYWGKANPCVGRRRSTLCTASSFRLGLGFPPVAAIQGVMRAGFAKTAFSRGFSVVRLFPMLILNPYTHDERFTLEADISINGSHITFEYAVSDRAGLFELPTAAALWKKEDVSRRDGLWNSTCFEAFLQPIGSEQYYEFNFSLQPAWQAYAFDGYRVPQPPPPALDFAIESLEWIPVQNRLVARVENRSPFNKFQVGLTAILQEKNQNKHYCALAHKGPKPDFHLGESFTLLRGV